MSAMILELHNSKNVIIDDCDYAALSQYGWCSVTDKWGCTYARAYVPEIHQTVFMHRLVMGAKKGQVVDHVNGNGLDNRRSNLRFCTPSQNSCNKRVRKDNKSGYKGVKLVKRLGKWRARIRIFGKRKELGVYKNIIDAAHAYDDAAREYFGEFAKTNF